MVGSPGQQPDLVLQEGDRSTIVVEVKGREIPNDLLSAVMVQLRNLVAHAGANWGILVTPRETSIFNLSDFSRPVSILATEDILRAVGLARPGVGKHTLLLATELWLSAIGGDEAFEGSHPELSSLLEDLRRSKRATPEYPFD